MPSAPPETPLPERPARGAGLEMGGGAAPLPRPRALGDPAARAVVLARLAHHELQAVELFAWAVLRWPDAPAALRDGWLRILEDEQRHCRLYLSRLDAHGRSFASFAPHSDYFFRQLPALDAAEHGPAAFCSAMGLTLEQANLDFSLVYRDGFAAAGDAASAAVCDLVHRDEIGHVAHARRGLELLLPALDGDRARYVETVPFPFSAARAKGRQFDVAAREAAGLDAGFIDYVRGARSSQERRGRTE